MFLVHVRCICAAGRYIHINIFDTRLVDWQTWRAQNVEHVRRVYYVYMFNGVRTSEFGLFEAASPSSRRQYIYVLLSLNINIEGIYV